MRTTISSPTAASLLGMVAYQTTGGKFTFEFWESDKLTAQLLDESLRRAAAAVSLRPSSLNPTRSPRKKSRTNRLPETPVC